MKIFMCFHVTKFSWMLHENILARKFCQLHVIEITVYVLPIMTSYLAIATSLLVLQRQQSTVRLYTDSFLKNTV